MAHVNEEGIFRISGSLGDIKELKTKFNLGEIFTIPNKPEYGVHEVAALLKSYLRDLPEPLLTFKGCESLSSLQSEEHASKIAGYKAVLNSLPEENKILLKQLMKLLHTIRQSPSAKMDPVNLGTMFGPCLMRSSDEVGFNMADMLKYNLIVSELISNYYELFTE